MKIRMSDRLRRFDDVFRTLLVIASILISGTLAFFKDLVPSYYFLSMMIVFVLSICSWTIGTLKGTVDEYIFKLFSWWSLMLAFSISLARFAFYSNPSPPKFVLTGSVVVTAILSYPMFAYFKNLTNPQDAKILKTLILVVMGLFVVLDVIAI